MDELKENWRRWNLEDETLAYTVWRTSFGRGYGYFA
jgi:hypothetical protein